MVTSPHKTEFRSFVAGSPTSIRGAFPTGASTRDAVSERFEGVLVSDTAVGEPRPETKTLDVTAISTSLEQRRRDAIEEELKLLFWASRDEVFEDGMTSVFAKNLRRLVAQHGNDLVETLTMLSFAERLNAGILAEALVTLARLDDPKTLAARRWLLAFCLFHSSPAVRDAAALGFDALGDSRARFYLRSALDRETVPELQHYIRELISEFER